jgi:hypothetical protein
MPCLPVIGADVMILNSSFLWIPKTRHPLRTTSIVSMPSLALYLTTFAFYIAATGILLYD